MPTTLAPSPSATLVADLTAIVGAARDALRDLQPEAVPLAEATARWAVWDELERIAAAGKRLLARRVEVAEAWKHAGYRSAAEALAAVSGTTVGEAHSVLDTSRVLAALPEVEDAVRRGTLSPAKADVVAATAAVAPGDAARLVATAESSTLRETRAACLEARTRVEGDELHERARRARRCVESVDELGAWTLHARGPVEAGAEVRGTLDALVDEVFRDASRAGAREPREAYAFDALVLMARRARGVDAAGVERARRDRSFLGLVRVDAAALRRGHAEAGEVCEIAGLGPVPVRVARELLGDAVLKLVITDGVAVANVTHLGRRPTAAQRAALLWDSPMCRVEGCASLRLQIDHRTPWAATHRTRLDELDPLCVHHHALKTRAGWELVPGRGRRPMVPRHDPRHPAHRRGPPASPG